MEKQRWEESEEKRHEEEKDHSRERIRRKKMKVREKGEKSRHTIFSNVLWLRRVEK